MALVHVQGGSAVPDLLSLVVPSCLFFFFLEREQTETSQRKSATSGTAIDTALHLKCCSTRKFL